MTQHRWVDNPNNPLWTLYVSSEDEVLARVHQLNINDTWAVDDFISGRRKVFLSKEAAMNHIEKYGVQNHNETGRG